MIISRRLVIWFSLISIFSILFLVFSSEISSAQNQFPLKSTSDPIDVTPTSYTVDEKINTLETRVDSLEKFLEIQSNSYSAAINRTESNMNVILSVMAVASILVALLGFSFVRIWIGRIVEERISKLTSDQIQEISKAEIEKMRQEWDPKFADLYEEYRKSISRR